MPRLKAANNARTTLVANISASATSFQVADASAFPDSGPFRITIDAEIMEVGTINKATNTFSNVQRGLENTAASTHSAGATVELRFTAGTYDELADAQTVNAHISANPIDHPDGSITLAKLAASAMTSAGGTEANRLARTNAQGKVGHALLADALANGSVRVDIFTASGTWTKPAGAKLVLVEVISGGGGGGGGDHGSPGSPGGGGGGGGRVFAILNASSLPSSVPVTVGAGGAGGLGSGNGISPRNGADGGNSAFGDVVSIGGQGGLNAAVGSGQYGGAGGGAYRSSTVRSEGYGFVGAGPVARYDGGVRADFGGGSGAGALRGGLAGGASFGGGGGGGSGAEEGGSAGQGGQSVLAGRGGNGGAYDQNGEDGVAPGGGGGGGGAKRSTLPIEQTKAMGGNGARGEVRVYTFF